MVMNESSGQEAKWPCLIALMRALGAGLNRLA